MTLFTAVLNRIAPRFRTFGQWSNVYDEILSTRPICPKTMANRRNSLGHLRKELSDAVIRDIRPHRIAQIVRHLHTTHPHTARRVLIEAKDCFSEAVAYGWADTNPAAPVKHLPTPISRKRLKLEDWRLIHAYASKNLPPWVSHMLVLAIVTGQRRADLGAMRFQDVHDGHLHVIQDKTGVRLRLPLALRLDALDITLGEAIEHCAAYAKGSDFIIRKHNGQPLALASLSARFETAREGALGMHQGSGAPPSLHECRSLSERLYRAQGIDTRTLLGHKRQQMTDVYNDLRGLDAGEWKTLIL